MNGQFGHARSETKKTGLPGEPLSFGLAGAFAARTNHERSAARAPPASLDRQEAERAQQDRAHQLGLARSGLGTLAGLLAPAKRTHQGTVLPVEPRAPPCARRPWPGRDARANIGCRISSR